MRAAALVLAVVLAGCGGARTLAVTNLDGVPLTLTPIGPPLEDARALALDPTGTLAIVDAGAAAVLFFDTLGVPLSSFGGPGTGAYAFLEPSDVDPGNGLVLTVADAGNGRLQRFSRDGRLLATIDVPSSRATESGGQEAGRPTAVAAAVTGELYAIDETDGVVMRWDDRRRFDRVVGGRGEGAGALRSPVDLALGPDGRLFVADRGHGAVLVYDAFGQYLRRIGDGQLGGVVALTVVGERLAVVFPQQVRLYSLDGSFVTALNPATEAGLVGVAGDGEKLFVLTRNRLYSSGLTQD